MIRESEKCADVYVAQATWRFLLGEKLIIQVVELKANFRESTFYTNYLAFVLTNLIGSTHHALFTLERVVKKVFDRGNLKASEGGILK